VVPPAAGDNWEGVNSPFSVLEVIPVVSFFYALLKAEVPHFEILTELFNVIGLLSALALSIAASIPGSVSFEELEEANRRYAEPPYSCYWDRCSHI
jgi:hypothetical protein